ncbi:MAG: DDE-type integrase/transposase/recombinase [Candidatus Hadarchaeota archaeon]
MNPKQNPKCPACGAGSWKIGLSKTSHQRYKCPKCGRKFDERDGTPFHRLRKPEKALLVATVLYTNYPLSSYQVKEIVGLFGIDVSARQIERWPERFGPSVKRIFRKYKIRFSKVWHVDEKFVPHDRVPSPKRKRGEKKWLYQITVLDSKNNVVASFLAEERNTEAAKKVLRRAKETAGFSPDFIVSDDCPIYDKGVNVLGRRTKHVTAHFEGKLMPHGKGVVLLSNNRIERYNSTLAPKVRSMRGVKSAERGDMFFQVYNFMHNFSRKGRMKRILGRLGLKLGWDGLTKLFHLARDF